MNEQKFFVHPKAICESNSIASGTRIWAFCNVQEKAVIGKDCNICDHCFVENNVVVGDRVTLKNGVSLWEGVKLEDDVFVGPNAVFTNDIKPRSKVYHDEPDRTLVRQGATIGANAVIIAGNTVGRYAFIGAGAVLTKSAPDFTIWLGNPARQAGFVCKCAERLTKPDDQSETILTCSCGLKYQFTAGLLALISDGGEGAP
jgi:acetyltransferase-like isoleucine patch superfamily enzyme